MIVDDVDSREAIGLDDLYCMECDQLCLSRGEMERVGWFNLSHVVGL